MSETLREDAIPIPYAEAGDLDEDRCDLDPSLFINRELSWLDFDERVLEEAGDPSVPLLERLRFLAITASNLDEFFEVRVAGLQAQLYDRLEPQDPPPEGLGPLAQLNDIAPPGPRVRRPAVRGLASDETPARGWPVHGVMLVHAPRS